MEDNLDSAFNNFLERFNSSGTIEKRDSTCLYESLNIERREQLQEWKKYKGFKFQIYNDHLIDGKPHFHLENESENINSKFDFNGNLLGDLGSPVDMKIQKILKAFVNKEDNKEKILQKWNKLNPENIF